MNEKPLKTITLTDDQRAMLEVIYRCRKVYALVWKRARAFMLLDAGEEAIYWILGLRF